VFKNISINNYVIEENASGSIDRIVVKLPPMTSRQAIGLFTKPTDKIPEAVQKDFDADEETNKKFTFYHYVGVRKDRIAVRLDAKGMEFESLYVEKDSSEMVRESGYRTFPYIVARFTKDPDEVYGRSPAITNLADIKQLNAMVNTFIKSAEKRLAPPMAVAYGTVMNTPKFEANGITYIRGNMADRPQPIDTAGDVGVGIEAINMWRNGIKEGFYTDMFDYLVGGQYMTATEVESRKQNKLFLLAPMLSRVQSEKLNAMLIRVYDILAEKGVFSEMPDILKENPNYEIRFNGKMALALKSIESNATQQSLALIANVAQYKPEILDNYDWNNIARGEALNTGMPSSYVRPLADVQAEREAKAKAEAQALQMQQVEQASKAVKNVSGDVGANSPAQAIANNVGL
jgi:glutaredoxin